MARIRLPQSTEPAPNLYFVSNKPNIQFVSSGCTILDCILGGGYPLGRIANIMGDKSTAKTHLACEAITNFCTAYPKGKPAYRDAEGAFDELYAEAMGMPIKKVDFGPDDSIATVEEFYNDLDAMIDAQIKKNTPGIYVLDSLDALSDDEEMKRDITDGTYAMNKQKQLGVLFRKLVRKIEKSSVLLVVISQIRDNVGVKFGDKYRRSGGKAMDFYASQFLYLTHLGQITKTINKVKRPIGIDIKVAIKKNKIGLPFRTCEVPFIFGYGIQDAEASVKYLEEVGRLADADIKVTQVKEFLKELGSATHDEYEKERLTLSNVVKQVFAEVETSFLPKRSKYA